MSKNDTTLKTRMEDINNSINNMVDDLIHDAMKNFKFGKFDSMDPMVCMYAAKGVNLLKDVMKLSVELCAELDDTKKSLDEIKQQNEIMQKVLKEYSQSTHDLLIEIKKELKK